MKKNYFSVNDEEKSYTTTPHFAGKSVTKIFTTKMGFSRCPCRYPDWTRPRLKILLNLRLLEQQAVHAGRKT
jgi:hypothetical protein